ncbi:hypothetical protein J6590_040047 [Homalodisca vitripennis]|nr:hypothetical protein J6590_040047 [Homalodisca vitripennis]
MTVFDDIYTAHGLSDCQRQEPTKHSTNVTLDRTSDYGDEIIKAWLSMDEVESTQARADEGTRTKTGLPPRAPLHAAGRLLFA